MALTTLRQQLQWYLVDNPTISSFQWQQGETFGSSPFFVCAAVICYLATVFVLRRRLLPLPSIPPPLLHGISTLHNIFLILLSAVMAIGCSLSTASVAASIGYPFCFPKGSTKPSGPVFFWAYVFYLSKLYEFGDTLLILLSGRPLTFLHVYHHACIVALCYLWVATTQSLMPVGVVLNASVHMVMYAYYLSCSVGWRWPPRCKRAVTEIQIVQFVLSFVTSAVFWWFHFTDGGCEGRNGWFVNAGFNASLLFLFVKFHGAAYAKGQSKKGKGE